MRTIARRALPTLLAALLPLGVAAQSPVSVSAELGFRSEYLFAGIPFAAEEVTHLTLTAGVGSFTFNGFGVYDHDASDVTELDLYGDYYVQASPLVGLFFGAALYTFKIADEWDPTVEAYAGAVLATPLNPTLYVAHDFDLGDGTHATLMLSQTVVESEESGLRLTLLGNLDYNDGYYTDISGFSYVDFGASLAIPVGPLEVTPTVMIQRGIDDLFTDHEVFTVRAGLTF